MERTNTESAAYLMLEAYKNTRQMDDALTLVASQNECTGVPYDVLQGMWLALDAYHDLNETHSCNKQEGNEMGINEIRAELQNVVVELNNIINNPDEQQKSIRVQESEEKFNWLVDTIRGMRDEGQDLYDDMKKNGLTAGEIEAEGFLRCIITVCAHIDRIESAYTTHPFSV